MLDSPIKLRLCIRFTWRVATVVSFFCLNVAICQENASDTEIVNYDSSWVQALLKGERGRVAENLVASIQKESSKNTTVKKTYRSRELWQDAELRDIILNFAQFGESAAGQLRDTVNTLSGPARDIVVIILGLQGDSTVRADLKSIVESSPNHTAREMAVLALSGFDNPADIAVFRAALEDTFWVTTHWDYILEDGRDSEPFYPVREKAAEALRSLGFQVTHDFSGNYTILREPKW